MTRYRVRIARDTPESGVFAWAELGAAGAAIQAGSSDVAPLPSPGPCDLIVASDMVSLHRVAVPAAQRRRLAGALQFLVEDLVVSDPERLHAVGAPAGGDDLCIGVVDKEWLRACLARLAAGGVRPERILPETLLLEIEPGTWTVVWRGTDSFARTGAAEGLSLDAPGDGSVPAALRLAMQRSSPGAVVVRVAGGTQVPDTERWSQELGVPVALGTPWEWSAGQAESRLDFLQGEFAPSRSGQGWRARLRRPVALAAALIVLASGGLAVDWAAKARARKALVAEMNVLYREAFGPNAVLVDPPLQMQRALAELRRRNGEPGATDFLSLLRVLTERMLDPATQRIDAMTYGNGRLSVLLRPQQPAAFAALVEELRGKAAIPGLEVKVDTVSSGEARQLRITAAAESGRWALAKP